MRPGAVALGIAVALSVLADSGWAEPADGPYRGMYVCEKFKMAPDILRAPIDLVVSGTTVRFGRPLFNFDGSRVTGTELGTGSIDGDGKVHLTSEWFAPRTGFIFQGTYDGTLAASGGALSGTQSWHGPNGESGSRTCTAAIVPSPRPQPAAAQEHEQEHQQEH